MIPTILQLLSSSWQSYADLRARCPERYQDDLYNALDTLWQEGRIEGRYEALVDESGLQRGFRTHFRLRQEVTNA